MMILKLVIASYLLAISDCNSESTKVLKEPLQPLQAVEKKPRTLEPIADLPGVLKECSGMVELGHQNVVALNDSGASAKLYVFNPEHPEDVKTVVVLGVKNHDWEELATDENHVYIGDTGNNGGKRQNLMIYKVRKTDLETKDSITAEIIKFSYQAQTKFTDSNRHNWDCEAFVCVGDSLFLFTKNRGDLKTGVCGFPKVPGTYVATIYDTYDSHGLVTGADYRKTGSGDELVLVGYDVTGNGYHPFVIHFTDFKGNQFFQGKSDRWEYDKVLQTETILFHNNNEVWISNEEEHGDEGKIYSLQL
ncbi:MAG: hypothetical protein M3R25_08470 [Bacteroidota bacterium]|nr:hypothetical protein [Bacteroidota bacterium]